MKSHVITIVEGHYHLGLGALANSLVASGFSGPITVFSRTAEPSWVREYDEALRQGNSQVRLHYRRIETDRHLSALKPDAMLEIFDTTDAETVFYFDPDIVLLARWDFFERWARCGVAMVEDGNYGSLPADHPHRHAWSTRLEQIGMPVKRRLSRYYNSGFVGALREHCPFVDAWRSAMNGVAEVVELSKFKPGTREDPYFGTDQDTLNMAAMATETPLSTLGPDGMGFTFGAAVMSHAIGFEKPWERRYVRNALGGMSPTQAEKDWARNLTHPIPVLPPGKVRSLKRAQKLAAAIGRFIRRS